MTLVCFQFTLELKEKKIRDFCTGSENYWCVNAKASEEDIQATVDFLTWCITSDEGRTAISKDMDLLHHSPLSVMIMQQTTFW